MASSMYTRARHFISVEEDHGSQGIMDGWMDGWMQCKVQDITFLFFYRGLSSFSKFLFGSVVTCVPWC